MNLLAKLRVDAFLLGLFAAMAIGVLRPARGDAGQAVETATKVAIAVLFLLYGTRLHPREALEGLKHWRLHTTVLAATFVLFPLLGLAMKVLVPSVLTDELYTRMLFLCLLPSTEQSSIAFTSIARGNVAAAVVSASASNLLGIFLTPLLVTLLMTTTGAATVSAKSILEIVLQLLMPFLAGQLLRSTLHRVLFHTHQLTCLFLCRRHDHPSFRVTRSVAPPGVVSRMVSSLRADTPLSTIRLNEIEGVLIETTGDAVLHARRGSTNRFKLHVSGFTFYGSSFRLIRNIEPKIAREALKVKPETQHGRNERRVTNCVATADR